MDYMRKSIVVRGKLVDLTSEDYEDKAGFFVRSQDGGDIKYLPVWNVEPITKTVEGSAIFRDPVLVKKIFKNGTTATNIYVGYGV